MKHRRAVSTAVAVAASGALILGGCSSSGSGSASTGSPSVSATASASSSATPSGPAWVTLPESALPALPGLVYAKGTVTDEEALAAVRSSTARPETVYGYLGRAITSQDQQIGGVQITRLREAVPSAERTKLAAATLKDFAQQTPSTSTIAGQEVQQADKARGTEVGTVLWVDGKDIVIVYAQGLSEARKLAKVFIEQGKK
jgi:hypothetical protein